MIHEAIETCGGADFGWLHATRSLSEIGRREAQTISASVPWRDDRVALRDPRDAASRIDLGRMVKPTSEAADRASDDTANRKRALTKSSTIRFEELMQAAQDGDGRAYAQLLKEVTPILRGAVRRRRSFLDAADIEDLVQETLLSLHVARATYDPQRPFLPWLFAILERRMADLGRRYARRSAHELQDADAALRVAADQDDARVEDYGERRLLAQAIRELPHQQRIAVQLLKLREMSLKDASAASGMSSTALRVAMHRALISLRKKLGVLTINGAPPALESTR